MKLNSKAVEVLKEQRKQNPFGEYVFISKNNSPLWTNKINDHLRDYCEKAEIRYLSSHSIRVTNITSLYDSGVSPTKIQVAAGHSDIRTINGYCRSEICDEIDMDILEKLLTNALSLSVMSCLKTKRLRNTEKPMPSSLK